MGKVVHGAGDVQDFADVHARMPSLEDMPLRCAASNGNATLNPLLSVQRSVCPSRTLAPLSGSHSLHGMREAFPEIMALVIGEMRAGVWCGHTTFALGDGVG